MFGGSGWNAGQSAFALCVCTAFAAKTLPLPCVSTAFAALRHRLCPAQGTIQLEFRQLSHYTNDPKYKNAA